MAQKKYILLGLCLVFLVSVSCGCDAVYRILQREGAEEKKLLGEIVPHERNEQVMRVQALLKLYGYKVGKVDGVLGANTREAIEVFQKNNNLKQTRFVDYATWEQLTIFEDYGLIVGDEVNTVAVQVALKEAGFDPGPLDGKFGRQSLIALKMFQEAEGLKPDGKVGRRTLQALSKFLEKQDF